MVSFLKREVLLIGVAAFIAARSVSAQDPKRAAPGGIRVVNVFSPVETRTTVVACKPEGAAVKKGEVVCELDAGPLNDRLAQQAIAIRIAEAAYRKAALAREVAELAVTEYEKGVYRQEFMSALGEISLAQASLKRAEDRVEWSDRMLAKGYISLARNLGDRIKLKQANLNLEKVQTQRDILEKFTKPKTVADLKAEVEEAKEDEAIKEAVYKQEETARTRLLRQVERCKVAAPAAGLVGYSRPFGEGAVVRDGDLLFQLTPESNQGAR